MTTRELEHPENGRISADAPAPKVSVIVPVFNPGPGFERCLESLRGQTLADIEMIFVDDCGTDGAIEKVRAAASDDPRIRVIANPENLGPGLSRNAGIEAARGEYLAFVDADDYVSPDFLELLHAKANAEGLDIAKGRRTRVDEEGNPVSDQGKVTHNNQIRAGLENGKPLYLLFFYNHWSAIYRTRFVRETGARYGSSRDGEDTTFLLRVCGRTKSMGVDDRAVYYYTVTRAGQTMRDFGPNRLKSELLAFTEQVDYVAENLAGDEYASEYIRLRVEYYLGLHRAFEMMPEHRARAAEYLEGIRKQVSRLPFRDAPARESVVLRALMEHGANLCINYYFPPAGRPPEWQLRADQAIRWRAFASAHPEFADEYNKDFQLVLKRAADAVAKARETAPQSGCVPGTKISVIVPVYNPGPGFDRCLESLRSQTLADIEMIFVDDRGTDGAMEKVRAAARDDPRIRIITNPENLGPGLARNAGIEAARGEYLSFVDADDYVSPDFLELLHDKAVAEGLDIAKGSVVYMVDGTPRQKDFLWNELIRSGLAAGKPLYSLFMGEHWTGLYRRALLVDSGARYGKARNSQDDVFLLRACRAARTFGMEPRATYHYVYRKLSVVNTFTPRRLKNQLENLREVMDDFVGQIAPDQDAMSYVSGKIMYLVMMQAHAAGLPGLAEAADELLSELRAQALRLPFIEDMKAESFVIRALVDFGVGLSLTPYRGLWWELDTARARIDLAKRWCDFALAHPELVDEYGMDLSKVLQNAAEAVKLDKKYGPRIDVKIYGTENSELELRSVSDKGAKVETPEWLRKSRQPGVGYVVVPHAGQTEITLDFVCKTGGEFTATLRGANVTDKSGKRIPKWVTYTGLACNGEAIFEGEQRAWHDQPYRYRKTVAAGDAVTLEIRWREAE